MTLFGNEIKARKTKSVTTTKIGLDIQVIDVEHASTHLAHNTQHASEYVYEDRNGKNIRNKKEIYTRLWFLFFIILTYQQFFFFLSVISLPDYFILHHF